MMARLFSIRTLLFFLLPVFILGCQKRSPSKPEPITMEELMIQVYGNSREIAYTNKQAGYFYTETNAEHRTGWQGWHIMSTKVMDDYLITVNGRPIRKTDAQLARVYPHQFVRAYPAGVQEHVTLLDSVDALVVELERIKGTSMTVSPILSASQLAADYVIKQSGPVMLIASKRHLQRTENENYPVWLGISIVGSPSPQIDSTPASFGTTNTFVRLQSPIVQENTTIIFVSGDTEEQAVNLAATVAGNYRAMIAQRKDRMERLVNTSYIRTDNEQLTKAINWAKLSMDALIMNQLKKGIFAGLPWFDNYWGRDSFIALPGATLVTGDFEDAKEILRSFAEWQDREVISPTSGRIPNQVTTTSIAYNTTDGTPWFISALDQYVKYSNDTAFAREMYPSIFIAIEGALSHHCDSLNFMTHNDQETWMDAATPEGCWSPRGNRANDIQALWYHEMQIAIAMAQTCNDAQSAIQWNGIIHGIGYNFNKMFVDDKNGFVYDHLNIDGLPDYQIRPNQLFTLNLIQDRDVRARVFRNVTEKLVYPWGVASLSQDDPNFHPYHHYSPYYVQDAAYHNGIVWTWLAGRWIDAAASYNLQDLSYQVTDNMVHQILDRGAVGTLSELLDAVPRPNQKEPQLSGTFSQAWSLAEFLRSFYQSYLGCTVDALVPRLTVVPKLPSSITHARFNIPIRTYRIDVEYEIKNHAGNLYFASPANAAETEIKLEWTFKDGTTRFYVSQLPPNGRLTFKLDDDKVTEITDAGSKIMDSSLEKAVVSPALFDGIKLAAPYIRPDLKALKGPSYRVLTNKEIKAADTNAKIVFEKSDPTGDDKGNGFYTYPLSTNLKAGSLDITRFTVSSDDKNLYFRLTFRNLSNPGWHAEYGFQLTYAAIAIDKDGKPKSGEVKVGANSNYILDSKYAYEDIIYVGGGVRIADAKGETIAEYLPAAGDEKNPLGNTGSKTVSFAVPIDILGTPNPSWHFTVLVGAQDDHGGAGVGEFRNVGPVAQEWLGGGKKNSNDPNVYDVILP
jgi:glycogen debranching enzyme